MVYSSFFVFYIDMKIIFSLEKEKIITLVEYVRYIYV